MSDDSVNARSNLRWLTYQAVQTRLTNTFHRTCAELKRDLPTVIGDELTRVAIRAAEAWAEELRGKVLLDELIDWDNEPTRGRSA